MTILRPTLISAPPPRRPQLSLVRSFVSAGIGTQTHIPPASTRMMHETQLHIGDLLGAMPSLESMCELSTSIGTYFFRSLSFDGDALLPLRSLSNGAFHSVLRTKTDASRRYLPYHFYPTTTSRPANKKHVDRMPKVHVVVDEHYRTIARSPIWKSSPSWPEMQRAAEIEQVKPDRSMHGTGAATGAAVTMLERSAPEPPVPQEERWWRRMAGTMFGVGAFPTFDSDVETELALDIGMELALIDLEHDLEQGTVRCTEPPLSEVDVLYRVWMFGK